MQTNAENLVINTSNIAGQGGGGVLLPRSAVAIELFPG